MLSVFILQIKKNYRKVKHYIKVLYCLAVAPTAKSPVPDISDISDVPDVSDLSDVSDVPDDFIWLYLQNGLIIYCIAVFLVLFGMTAKIIIDLLGEPGLWRGTHYRGHHTPDDTIAGTWSS